MFNFFSKEKQPAKFWFNTDIHCHILPGVDDGAQTVDESLAIVNDLCDMGITRIIASPHITQITFENTPETLQNAQLQLDQAISNTSLKVEISHAAENRIDDLLAQNIENKTLLTLPGNFLLIENAFMQEPMQLDELVFDLQVRGYRPILAHPERYAYYMTRQDRYKHLHKNNLLFQINALSLAGAYGKAQKKTAEWLIDNKLVDFVGTDVHNTTHTQALKKYLTTSDAKRHAKKLGNILNDKI